MHVSVLEHHKQSLGKTTISLQNNSAISIVLLSPENRQGKEAFCST